MKRNQRSHFIAVLPALALAACPVRTSNPPEPPQEQTPPKGETQTPPELLLPPVSYGPRRQSGPDCYVTMSANPPMNIPVSCTAPIEPNGKGGCTVASVEDASKKVPVECEPDK